MSESSSDSHEPSRPAPPPTQEGFKLSPQDVTILRGYMDEFEEADTQMRNKILEKAMGEVYKRQPGNSQFNKKEAKQKIKKWYYNHYNPPHRQVIKFVRRWSARNVFYYEDKVDIMKLAEDMSGAAPGTEAFLGSIQLATTELWKKLPVEEQERFAQTADEWSDNGPPKGIQAKPHRHRPPSSLHHYGPPTVCRVVTALVVLVVGAVETTVAAVTAVVVAIVAVIVAIVVAIVVVESLGVARRLAIAPAAGVIAIVGGAAAVTSGTCVGPALAAYVAQAGVCR
ncbi:hypothetical protein EDB85DRAFT_2155028 [Lactarius pseudohatsudake]|nr:hypothetical protein EDB85DRAFT_2155028 [Lactarius pseudohatsudake]